MTAEIIYDFLAKRYAKIYVDFFTKDREQANAWARAHIKKEDKSLFQKYVIAELTARGYTNIKPGNFDG